jgi:hypothetical protein
MVRVVEGRDEDHRFSSDAAIYPHPRFAIGKTVNHDIAHIEIEKRTDSVGESVISWKGQDDGRHAFSSSAMISPPPIA